MLASILRSASCRSKFLLQYYVVRCDERNVQTRANVHVSLMAVRLCDCASLVRNQHPHPVHYCFDSSTTLKLKLHFPPSVTSEPLVALNITDSSFPRTSIFCCPAVIPSTAA